MYNYGAPGYSGAPGLAGPPGMAPPPGMGAPPGMGVPPGLASASVPGITPPPGLMNAHAQSPAMGAGRGMPSAWQPPPNMPNINFNAPVIHFGTSGPPRGMAMDGPGGRRESGAPSGRRGGNDGGGRDADQAQRGKDVQSLVAPPSREEIARTIFIGNIPDGVGGDEGMVRILTCAGNLRRWTPCTDSKGKPCSFGFAEYEDAESLETAIEIFKDVYVPTERQRPGSKVKKEEPEVKTEGDGDVKMGNTDEDEVKKTKLQVLVDENSKQYAEDWKKRRGDDDSVTLFRFHTAQEALDGVLASLFNPKHIIPSVIDVDMENMQAKIENDRGEVVTIQISADDELSEIPEDKRETVAAEIAAFRDRANRRDQERLALEERIEAEERNKMRASRMGGSPPASAPRGPAGANGVPLGPRADQTVPGAPNGPRGGQFPSDYKGGVSFVNGNGKKWLGRPEDLDPRSDEVIEAQRQEQRRMELDREFRSQERFWLQREGKTNASLRRHAEFEGQKQQMRRRHKEQQAHRLKNWDDAIEAQQPLQRLHMYYRDRGIWARDRNIFLQTELHDDAVDRAQEDQQLAVLLRQKEIARGKADAFLSEQAEELARRMPVIPQQPQRFKLSLGAAAKRVEEAAASRRTGADIASLLDDEEEAGGPVQKRELVPIKFDPSIRANLTSEEIAEAQQQLAREIPNDKESLWKWNISWNSLPEKNIDQDIKDWAEKKIVESLGVQEDMLVDAIVEHVRQRKKPQSLVEELSEFLEDDAEQLVRKLWRMVIYYSESEKRGIK